MIANALIPSFMPKFESHMWMWLQGFDFSWSVVSLVQIENNQLALLCMLSNVLDNGITLIVGHL